MKESKIILGLFIVIVLTGSAIFAQQQITQTVTKLNTGCNYGCSMLDVPALNGNPAALIFVTPIVENGRNPNPHPIGANYRAYEKKWSIFNLDGTSITEGAKFNVQYYQSPDADRFVYVVPKGVDACIDNGATNNNPAARLTVFPTVSPTRGAFFNRNEIKVGYDASVSKWCITNVNDYFSVPIGTAYNILVSPGTSSAVNVPNISVGTGPAPTPPAPIGTVTGQQAPFAAPPFVRPPTEKSLQLGFGKLNDFAEKGLPVSASPPTGDLDMAAVLMARQILRSDENSLPVLLAALQTAGFTIIDENGKVILRPADGKGQGLGIYDFEAVGALKVESYRVSISLEKLAAVITKQTPEISATQFAGMMLQELRAQADNPNNAYARFHARFIIELGKTAAKPVDLMTAPASNITLSVLQATLILRRLQGTFYVLNTKAKQTGMTTRPYTSQNIFIPVSSNTGINLFSRPAAITPGCDLTGNEALTLDFSAIGITAWNGWQMGALGADKLGKGVGGANVALAWLKLVAAVTMMKGVIVVSHPLPLVRTPNSLPGQKRVMLAKVWSVVGHEDLLNCYRPLVNLATGLDFNLPSNGPLGNVAIEWQFEGENATAIETKKFVFFQAPPGADPKPNKQVTDAEGVSQMWLVGSPKVPAVVYQKNPMEVEKSADVLVGVTLKSAKDVVQNVIDLIGVGATVGIAIGTGDPYGLMGLLGTPAEIGFRSPFVAARLSIPVTDHEPCDGQWQGTVSYSVIKTHTAKKTIIAHKSPMAITDGGHDDSEELERFSGSISLDGSGIYSTGRFQGPASGSTEYEYIYTNSDLIYGKIFCTPLTGYKAKHTGSESATFGSGSSSGNANVSINLDKDNYSITILPPAVLVNVSHSSHSNSFDSCNTSQNKPSSSDSNDTATKGAGSISSEKMSYYDSRTVLKDSSTVTIPSKTTTHQDETSTTTSSGSVVIKIMWNLKRCG